jgi:predicted transposase YbfD/YdcC
LVSVLVIAIMGVLAGASGPTGIAKWARLKEDLLKKLLPLPNGVPRKDVFRRVLATLKPDAFQVCFVNWLKSLRDASAEAMEITQPVVAIDGKTLRRSHDKRKGLGALHSVSAWASEFGISLGQVATEEKSNEITAIPELLKLIDIHGAIITIDAMGTQTAIAAQIIAGGGDYVLALKGNQGNLYQAAIDFVDKEMETDFTNCDARRHVTKETGHGREEIRHYIQMPAPKSLPGFRNWKGLLTIGAAMLSCIRNGKESADIRYFISSLPMGVKRFAHAVRAHWGIENTCHWSLDVTYREDESRIRDKHMRENFAWLNRFTLSLLKQHPGKDSLAMKRRSCGWSDEFLVQTLTGITT